MFFNHHKHHIYWFERIQADMHLFADTYIICENYHQIFMSVLVPLHKLILKNSLLIPGGIFHPWTIFDVVGDLPTCVKFQTYVTFVTLYGRFIYNDVTGVGFGSEDILQFFIRRGKGHLTLGKLVWARPVVQMVIFYFTNIPSPILSFL